MYRRNDQELRVEAQAAAGDGAPQTPSEPAVPERRAQVDRRRFTRRDRRSHHRPTVKPTDCSTIDTKARELAGQTDRG
jgi:hypothetical protein